MVRTAALLLLLAAAANLQMSAAASDFTDCPISYYGKEYTSLEVILTVESGSICFRENQAATHDCIDVGYVSNVDDYSVTLNQGHKDLTPHLASITDTSTCSVTIAFKDGPTSIAWVKLYRAESKAALSISYNSDADHEGAPSSLYVKTINGKSIALSQGDLDGKEHYLDISGCRSSGYTVAAGSEKKVSSTCTTISCSEHLVAAETGCDSGMICMLGTCVPENPGFAAPGGGDADDIANTVVCTVTGSSVINFFNTKQDIPDRCAYTLLKPLSGSDFELVAVFKERRRKDVTLLDHLIISYSGKKIYLGQGVRAQVDDTDLQLSDQFETHHNVELRKDSSGVTAKIPSTGMKVVFDGNTAHLSGLDNEAVQGLCGTPTLPSATTSPSNEKSSDSETG
ncbi:uncharacterized protein LOC121965910, partial [Plectropomus leopardus]|uniref:uncharacterized protein LOC121965910 n=1 Tax=Plectropomus leopardus TaxID=160734 RepID=UPI001C4AE60C